MRWIICSDACRSHVSQITWIHKQARDRPYPYSVCTPCVLARSRREHVDDNLQLFLDAISRSFWAIVSWVCARLSCESAFLWNRNWKCEIYSVCQFFGRCSKTKMKKSNPKCPSLSNIDSIISKFEAKKVPNSPPLATQDNSHQININRSLSKSIGSTAKRKANKRGMSLKELTEFDDEQCVDGQRDDHVIAKSKSMTSRTCQRSCFDYLYRWIFILLKIPFFSSINRAGLATLSCTFFLPRFFSQLILYPIFRLIFGTLYPAYASYKAVRTKKDNEYVSKAVRDLTTFETQREQFSKHFRSIWLFSFQLKWLMYWIVFAFFTSCETFTDVLLSWLPFYYEMKVLVVLWVLSPATEGSSVLYRNFVHPMLNKREKVIMILRFFIPKR